MDVTDDQTNDAPEGAMDVCKDCRLPIKYGEFSGWNVYPRTAAPTDEPDYCPGSLYRDHTPSKH